MDIIKVAPADYWPALEGPEELFSPAGMLIKAISANMEYMSPPFPAIHPETIWNARFAEVRLRCVCDDDHVSVFHCPGKDSARRSTRSPWRARLKLLWDPSSHLSGTKKIYFFKQCNFLLVKKTHSCFSLTVAHLYNLTISFEDSWLVFTTHFEWLQIWTL